MILDRLPRFSVLMILLAAGALLRARPVARCADAGKQAQASIPAPRPFVLTVVGPDGKILPRVPVQIRSQPQITAIKVREGRFLRSESGAVFVEADAKGRAAFEPPKNLNRFDVLIEMAGYAAYRARWIPGDHAEPIPLAITANLEPGWSVGGIFVDAEGKPIAGAKIIPWIDQIRRAGDSWSSGYFDSSAATDAEGKWHFDSVPASLDEVLIAVDHPDFITSRRTYSRTEAGLDGGRLASARIVLRRGQTLTGKITDEAGKPMGGALVQVAGEAASRECGVRRAVTRPDGGYVVRGCEPTATKMVVSAPGRAINARDFHLKPGMQPVNLHMQPGGTVRIRVIDERGNGVPLASIWLREWGRFDPYFEFDGFSRVTDSQGRWECREVSLDEIDAEISISGRAEIPRQSLVARKEEYVIRVPATPTVAGTVVDKETHQAIKQFRVTQGGVIPPDTRIWNWRSCYPATDGRYGIELGFGRMIRIDANGYEPAISRVIQDNEGNATIDFELTKGQDFEATVVTPDGRPAAKAKVALCIPSTTIDVTNGTIPSRPSAAGLQETDRSGNFRFSPQEPGFGLVITHASGYAYFLPAARASNRRIITLDPWTRVEGTYRLGGRPHAHIPISIALAGDRPPEFAQDLMRAFAAYHAMTGPNGRFVFERVESGRASIGRVLMKDGYATSNPDPSSSVAATISPGKTVHVDINEEGRSVVGRLRPPAGFTKPVKWNFARVRAEPHDRQGYPLEAQLTTDVGPDGSFRIDNVASGDYLLDVHFTQLPAGHLCEHHFVVPTAEGDSSSKVIDLGVLTLLGN